MKEPLQRSECKFCHYPVNLQIKHFTLSLHEPIQFPVTYSTAKVLLRDFKGLLIKFAAAP